MDSEVPSTRCALLVGSSRREGHSCAEGSGGVGAVVVSSVLSAFFCARRPGMGKENFPRRPMMEDETASVGRIGGLLLARVRDSGQGRRRRNGLNRRAVPGGAQCFSCSCMDVYLRRRAVWCCRGLAAGGTCADRRRVRGGCCGRGRMDVEISGAAGLGRDGCAPGSQMVRPYAIVLRAPASRACSGVTLPRRNPWDARSAANLHPYTVVSSAPPHPSGSRSAASR
jgi:hypothetical protein